MLNIQKIVENNTAVFTLEGRLDTVTASEFERVLVETLPDLTDLTLDLTGLDYISSAGLRILLSAQKQMNRQGEMKITGVNETIAEIFEVTGFSTILTIL